MIFLDMFMRFAGFGLVCFGGGYMLVPILMDYLTGDEGMFSIMEFANLVSIAQVTPGPIGINAATYVGYLRGGFWGALGGTLGLLAPSLAICFFVCREMRRYRDSFVVRGILNGVRPAALALCCYAAVIFLELSVFTGRIPWGSLARGVIPDGFGVSWRGLLICAASVALLKTRTKIPVTLIILGGAAAGAALAAI